MIKYRNRYNPLLICGISSDRLHVVKAFILTLALAVFSTSAFAEDWTTTDGTKYQNVQVIRVEDDAVTIIYKDGGALVFLNKLPPALQERFDYDPVKAKAAAEARTKADAENAKELQAEIEKANEVKREQAIRDAEARGYTNSAPVSH
jgi:hypothetical protein